MRSIRLRGKHKRQAEARLRELGYEGVVMWNDPGDVIIDYGASDGTIEAGMQRLRDVFDMLDELLGDDE
jgi:hypothetical protein